LLNSNQRFKKPSWCSVRKTQNQFCYWFHTLSSHSFFCISIIQSLFNGISNDLDLIFSLYRNPPSLKTVFKRINLQSKLVNANPKGNFSREKKWGGGNVKSDRPQRGNSSSGFTQMESIFLANRSKALGKNFHASLDFTCLIRKKKISASFQLKF